jgi:hypothetical protein
MAKQQNDFISGLSDEQKGQIEDSVKRALMEMGVDLATEQRINTTFEPLYLQLGLMKLGTKGSEGISLHNIPENVRNSFDSKVRNIIQNSSNNETLISNDILSSIISDTILKIAAEVKAVPIPPPPPPAALSTKLSTTTHPVSSEDEAINGHPPAAAPAATQPVRPSSLQTGTRGGLVWNASGGSSTSSRANTQLETGALRNGGREETSQDLFRPTGLNTHGVKTSILDKLEIKKLIRLGLLTEGRLLLGKKNETSSQYKALNRIILREAPNKANDELNGVLKEGVDETRLVRDINNRLTNSGKELPSMPTGLEGEIRNEILVLKQQLLALESVLFWSRVVTITMSALLGARTAQAIFPRNDIPIISNVVKVLKLDSWLMLIGISYLAIDNLYVGFVVELDVPDILSSENIKASSPSDAKSR